MSEVMVRGVKKKSLLLDINSETRLLPFRLMVVPGDGTAEVLPSCCLRPLHICFC